MIFQQSAKFLLAIANSIGKMQMHHTKQVATVRVHNVSVRNSGIEFGTAVRDRYWAATDRIPQICIWNSSTQISANRQISSPQENVTFEGESNVSRRGVEMNT